MTDTRQDEQATLAARLAAAERERDQARAKLAELEATDWYRQALDREVVLDAARRRIIELERCPLHGERCDIRIATLEAQLADTRAALGRAAEALERIATMPVDSRGQAYYWEGRDIAREAAGLARAAGVK